jgi:hypothetical protein
LEPQLPKSVNFFRIQSLLQKDLRVAFLAPKKCTYRLAADYS